MEVSIDGNLSKEQLLEIEKDVDEFMERHPGANRLDIRMVLSLKAQGRRLTDAFE